MASVQGVRACEKCGGVLDYEIDCRTKEETHLCLRCGYIKQVTAQMEDDGTTYKRDENNNIVLNYVELDGYGTAFVSMKEGGGCTYAFSHSLTKEQQEQMLEEIKAAGGENSYFVLHDPVSGEFTALYGEVPPTWDEFEAENGQG